VLGAAAWGRQRRSAAAGQAPRTLTQRLCLLPVQRSAAQSLLALGGELSHARPQCSEPLWVVAHGRGQLAQQ